MPRVPLFQVVNKCFTWTFPIKSKTVVKPDHSLLCFTFNSCNLLSSWRTALKWISDPATLFYTVKFWILILKPGLMFAQVPFFWWAYFRGRKGGVIPGVIGRRVTVFQCLKECGATELLCRCYLGAPPKYKHSARNAMRSKRELNDRTLKLFRSI